MFSKQIEKVVRPSKREDDLFDICDEDGIFYCTITENEFKDILKPIQHKGKILYKFYRLDGDYIVYSVSKLLLSKHILNFNETEKNR